MTDFIIRDGRILDRQGERHADLLIRNGEIQEIGTGLDAVGAKVLDAAGCYVTPGLVDIHTHLRDFGESESETIETASRAAVLGGYTAVVAMPNTDPAIDTPAMVALLNEKTRDALCEVIPAAAMSMKRSGEQLVGFGSLHNASVRIFTDDGDYLANTAIMRQALIHLSQFDDVVVAQHCEEPSLVKGGQMHAGVVADELGITGRPAEAEAIALARDIELLRENPMRYHALHVSTRRGIELIREAKRKGLPVTCEVTPQHLIYTDAACNDLDPRFKLNPPLRTEDDGEALREGLLDGTVDAIATDHAPHSPETKEDVPFQEAKPGMLGLETALAVVITELVLPGVITIEQAIGLLSWFPADVYGIKGHDIIREGRPANITVIDSAEHWTVDAQRLASKSQNSPWHEQKLTGRTRHTIVRGEPVVIDSEAQR